MNIERYEVNADASAPEEGVMVPDIDGGWVRYEDHAAVVNRIFARPEAEAINAAIEKCAVIAGGHAATHDTLKGAHYRNSPQMFDPVQYGLDMEVVKWSRNAALKIRSLKIREPQRREDA